MPDLRVWGYGIRSMPTTLTHVAPLGLWCIWLSRVLYTCRTSGAKRIPDYLRIMHYVSRILYTYAPRPDTIGMQSNWSER